MKEIVTAKSVRNMVDWVENNIEDEPALKDW